MTPKCAQLYHIKKSVLLEIIRRWQCAILKHEYTINATDKTTLLFERYKLSIQTYPRINIHRIHSEYSRKFALSASSSKTL